MSPPQPNLARELETYHSHREELLRTAEGQFAVIQGDRIAGVYPTRAVADDAAAALGPAPALIKRIEPPNRPRRAFFPRC